MLDMLLCVLEHKWNLCPSLCDFNHDREAAAVLSRPKKNGFSQSGKLLRFQSVSPIAGNTADG